MKISRIINDTDEHQLSVFLVLSMFSKFAALKSYFKIQVDVRELK